MYLVKLKQNSNCCYMLVCYKRNMVVAIVTGLTKEELYYKVLKELRQRQNRLNFIPYKNRNTYKEGIEVYKHMLNKIKGVV